MNIYERCVIEWGKTTQIVVVMEELAELIQACSKYIRNGKVTNNLYNEIADVEIMIGQLKHIADIDEDKLAGWKATIIKGIEHRLYNSTIFNH